jgi:ketosteroid isomerase-like protein
MNRLLPVVLALAVPLTVAAKNVKDKSKPVRRALEATYATLESAIERNDADAILAFRAPNFRAIDAQGNEATTEAMAERTRLMVAAIRPPIDAGFELGVIDLRDDGAVATVRQSFARMQLMSGKLRSIVTSVTQDETWIETPDGWKLSHVENLRDLAWYVDGQRVEPGRPYDPDAPPYVPQYSR